MIYVSCGNRVIGTNDVLPTGGRRYLAGSGSVGKYLKTVTHQEVPDTSQRSSANSATAPPVAGPSRPMLVLALCALPSKVARL